MPDFDPTTEMMLLPNAALDGATQIGTWEAASRLRSRPKADFQYKTNSDQQWHDLLLSEDPQLPLTCFVLVRPVPPPLVGVRLDDLEVALSIMRSAPGLTHAEEATYRRLVATLETSDG